MRELDLDKLVLKPGSHKPDGEFCVMEAVAYVAGEPWTDSPKCACPILSAFMRRWNDDLDDAGRQTLKPYIPRLVGTKSTKAIEQRRGWMLADWMVRTHTPAWLDLAGLKDQASALRDLPELTKTTHLKTAMEPLNEGRKLATATWAAAGDAAWDAAGDAAGAATWAAAGDAAGAAAWDAAWAAAGDAAWAAAWAAAGKKLEPTKLSLQASALKLLDDMIALSETA